MKYLNINENRKDRYTIVVLFWLIVVLFDFLNIKSVKTYAIPYIFSTTLLLYKLDTLLLKQENMPVLDITYVISNTDRFFCFNSTVSYTRTRDNFLFASDIRQVDAGTPVSCFNVTRDRVAFESGIKYVFPITRTKYSRHYTILLIRTVKL